MRIKEVSPISNYSSNLAFKAMKSSQFKGFDYAAMRKFTAPIEKFNNTEGFYAWADKLFNILSTKNYKGRMQQTIRERKEIIAQWVEYLLRDKNIYTPAMRLLALGGVVKNIGEDDDNLPLTLNQGVLADTFTMIHEALEENKDNTFDFANLYQKNLRTSYLTDAEEILDEGLTGWVKIPSKAQDGDNFEDNINKLKTFSYKTWCTKSFKAKPYLEDGEFRVYFQNGQPKIGIRYIGDSIEEIQGVKNDKKIPLEYLKIVEEEIKGTNLRFEASESLKNARNLEKELLKAKIELADAINANDAEKIYQYFGIETTRDTEGKLSLSHYEINDLFSALGLDEDELFKQVKEIKGDASFGNSRLKTLHNLKTIGGNASFAKSSIVDLGELTSIGGNAILRYSNVKSLNKVKDIGGDLNLTNSLIQDLGGLETIGSTFILGSSSLVKDLGKLRTIGKDACLNNTILESLGNIEEIGGNLDISSSNIKTLNKLRKIEGNAILKNSYLQDLGELASVGMNVDISGTKIESLNKLEEIGGDLIADTVYLADLGFLKRIKGSASLSSTKVESLGNLEEVFGSIYLSNSNIKDLGKLRYVGNDFDLSFVKIETLGQLEEIGRNADLRGAVIYNFGNLTGIGGNLDLSSSHIPNLGRLQNVGGYLKLWHAKVDDWGMLNNVKGNIILDRDSSYTAEHFKDIKYKDLLVLG